MNLSSILTDGLKKMQHVNIFGPEKEKDRTSIVSFNVRKVQASDVVHTLEENGIIFAKRDLSKKTIVRASPHFFNQEREIQRALEVIKSLE